MYTVEIYKVDRRCKKGERLILKRDHDLDLNTLQHVYRTTYRRADGFRIEIHETYVTSKNLLTGQEFTERYDTPYYCSPRSETYWSS